MRTSAPGSSVHPQGPGLARLARGFTLIELLVVVALVALASATVSLALRDPDAAQLDREAARLAAVLESARAESRASGLPVWWVPAARGDVLAGASGPSPTAVRTSDTPPDFRFVGLSSGLDLPQRWLASGTQAVVLGAPALRLGPEPLIGAQRVLVQRGPHRLVLATDGLAPFTVVDGASTPAP
jgi:general secretion pathway protein H